MINFESAPLGSISGLAVAPGVTLFGSLTNAFPGNITENPGDDPAGGFNTTMGGSRFAQANFVTFVFDEPIQAFGAYLTGLNSGGGILHIDYQTPHSNQSIFFSSSGPTTEFLGFTDPGQLIERIGIDYFSAVLPGPMGVDDVRFVPATVPDTGSALMLLSSALVGLGAIRRISTH